MMGMSSLAVMGNSLLLQLDRGHDLSSATQQQKQKEESSESSPGSRRHVQAAVASVTNAGTGPKRDQKKIAEASDSPRLA